MCSVRHHQSTPTSADLDGLDVLDVCHRHMLIHLGKLAALVSRLGRHGADAEARVLAGEILRFFATTSREHHEDEERHVFPKLLAAADAVTMQAVERLRQDHFWLEEDWSELAPELDALASGQSWVDIDVLREQVEVFTALSQDHIALEESLIYPQARAALAKDERLEMGREMAARRRAARHADGTSRRR
ncbi:MAG: hemerythrin domain-containing protein [Proteobacteria bacterium]|nr:hemerythrin domain-containing protein [Pseudomonadota bacterium]